MICDNCRMLPSIIEEGSYMLEFLALCGFDFLFQISDSESYVSFWFDFSGKEVDHRYNESPFKIVQIA